jgi:hypothetical protein
VDDHPPQEIHHLVLIQRLGSVDKLSSLEIFVKVLGGSPEDVQAWATAWRQIAMDEFSMIGRERRSRKARDEDEPPRLSSASSRSPID